MDIFIAIHNSRIYYRYFPRFIIMMLYCFLSIDIMSNEFIQAFWWVMLDHQATMPLEWIINGSIFRQLFACVEIHIIKPICHEVCCLAQHVKDSRSFHSRV